MTETPQQFTRREFFKKSAITAAKGGAVAVAGSLIGANVAISDNIRLTEQNVSLQEVVRLKDEELLGLKRRIDQLEYFFKNDLLPILPTCVVFAEDPENPGLFTRVCGLFGPTSTEFSFNPKLNELVRSLLPPGQENWKLKAKTIPQGLPPYPEPIKPENPKETPRYIKPNENA